MKVTIRCERDDGQFAESVTQVPDDLESADTVWQRQIETKIGVGFVECYRRAAQLPPPLLTGTHPRQDGATYPLHD